MMRTLYQLLVILSFIYSLVACGGGGGEAPSATDPTSPTDFSVGVSVSGLAGTLILQNNGSDLLSVSADGSFAFSSTITDGGIYNVTVATQPNGQICTVNTGAGTISGGNITNVDVNCSNNNVGAPSLISIDVITASITIEEGLSQQFTAVGTYDDGTTQPITNSVTWQSSSIAVGTILDSGFFTAVTTGDVNITATFSGVSDSIAVSVIANSGLFSIGGTVSGLTGSLVLQNNNTNDLTISSNGSFVFSTALADSNSYDVSVLTQPSTGSCTVGNEAGMVNGSNVTNVTITCMEVTANTNLNLSPSSSFKLAVGGEIEIKARVLDNLGNLIINTPSNPVIVTWESSNNAIATVDDEGLVKGAGVGNATITARVGTSASAFVPVAVEFSNMGSIMLNPSRLAMDVGSLRRFDASAIDTFGAPTTLDCIGGASLFYENTAYFSATYDNALGAEGIDVAGLQKGYDLITLNCGGFKSTPVIVEVNPAVTIPNPSPSSSADFGIQPSIALGANEYHISSYDQTNGKLIYTHFAGIWSSEILDGNGDYGRKSQIITDPLNSDLPVIFAMEDGVLTSWKYNSFGFWSKSGVENITPLVSAYSGEISVAINSAGVIYLLYYNEVENALELATSTNSARNDWTISTILLGGGAYNSITIGSDDRPRIAMQFQDTAYYGAMDSNDHWNFEPIDDSISAPAPGTGIKLAIGDDNRPQVIYYKNGNLIHAQKFGGAWYSGVVENVNTGGSYEFGFAVDQHSLPRITYYDAASSTMRYAYKLRSARLGTSNLWRIETPESDVSVGSYNELKLDMYNRATIAYYDAGAQEVQFYVEPHFLDYTAPDMSNYEGLNNTLVDNSILNTGLGTVSGLNVSTYNANNSNTMANSIAWDQVAGADSYNIYWNTTGNVTTADTRIVNVTTTNGYRHDARSSGTYYYRVSVVYGARESELSTEVSTNVPWGLLTSPSKRYWYTTEFANGKVYNIGGSTSDGQTPSTNNGTTLDRVEEYDPATDTWSTKSPMPTARWRFTSAVVNGKIYVMGGYDSAGFILTSVEEYDPASDTWSAKASMPRAISGLSSAAVNGKIYIMRSIYAYEYDPATDTWSTKSPMPTNRYDVEAVTANGKIYAMSGQLATGGNASIVEEYDPVTDTWGAAFSMPINVVNMGSAVLNDMIYFVYASSKYDPVTNTYTPKTLLPLGYYSGYGVSDVINGLIYVSIPTAQGSWLLVYNPALD